MHVYKFRIIAEDHENFFREIEIKPAHTFEDFHNAILDCVNMEDGEMAVFSNGEAHFSEDNGDGTIYIGGNAIYKGRIEGRKIIYI